MKIQIKFRTKFICTSQIAQIYLNMGVRLIPELSSLGPWTLNLCAKSFLRFDLAPWSLELGFFALWAWEVEFRAIDNLVVASPRPPEKLKRIFPDPNAKWVVFASWKQQGSRQWVFCFWRWFYHVSEIMRFPDFPVSRSHSSQISAETHNLKESLLVL